MGGLFPAVFSRSILILVFVVQTAFASETGLEDTADGSFEDPILVFNIQRRNEQLAGMSVLLGWSLANMGVSSVGWARAETPEWIAFHQGNIGWNAVNMALALPGVLAAYQDDPAQHTLGDSLRLSHASRVAFAFNTGLDVGWVMMGMWLIERGERLGDPQLLGLGRSMIVQGGFLFLFDLALWMKRAAKHRRFVATPVIGEQLGVRISTSF